MNSVENSRPLGR